MERMIQQDGTGCGLACVAMLVGEEYETVRDQAMDVLPPLFNDGFGRRRGTGYSLWTCTWHLRELLRLYDLRLNRYVPCNEQMRDQLQRAGHLGGEACAGLGVAARAVLDFGVGVTHHLLEHDVDKRTPLVTCAGGVGEVFAAARARFDGEYPDVLAGTGVGALRIVVRGPFALGAGTGAGGGVVRAPARRAGRSWRDSSACAFP